MFKLIISVGALLVSSAIIYDFSYVRLCCKESGGGYHSLTQALHNIDTNFRFEQSYFNFGQRKIWHKLICRHVSPTDKN